MKKINDLLKHKRFIVCVGSGGVGKTTVSCLLGLMAGMAGKKTLIVTIDPAKRLADALGISVGNVPQPINSHIKGFDPEKSGEVFAMMLDLQVAWDSLVERLSQSDEQRDKVLENRFYKYLSQDLAGSQEFVACEALYALAHDYDFDTIILDTPPTVNALDFLDAPRKIIGFLEQEAFRFFLRKKNSLGGKLGLSFLGGASAALHAILEKFTGKTFVEEFIDFLRVLNELYPPFVERTKGFEQLLKSKDTSFVIVSSPREASIDEAILFENEIGKRGYDLALIICNKITAKIKPALSKMEVSEYAKILAVPSKRERPLIEESIWRIISDQKRAAAHDARMLKKLKQQHPETGIITLPELPQDPAETNSLGDLLQILKTS